MFDLSSTTCTTARPLCRTTTGVDRRPTVLGGTT